MIHNLTTTDIKFVVGSLCQCRSVGQIYYTILENIDTYASCYATCCMMFVIPNESDGIWSDEETGANWFYCPQAMPVVYMRHTKSSSKKSMSHHDEKGL